MVVLVGWAIGKLTDLNFEIFMIALLVLSILVVGNFLRDKECNYLEGALLVVGRVMKSLRCSKLTGHPDRLCDHGRGGMVLSEPRRCSIERWRVSCWRGGRCEAFGAADAWLNNASKGALNQRSLITRCCYWNISLLPTARRGGCHVVKEGKVQGVSRKSTASAQAQNLAKRGHEFSG